jgi:hypothetical protein
VPLHDLIMEHGHDAYTEVSGTLIDRERSWVLWPHPAQMPSNKTYMAH